MEDFEWTSFCQDASLTQQHVDGPEKWLLKLSILLL